MNVPTSTSGGSSAYLQEHGRGILIRVVAFDMDGTLLDSREAIRAQIRDYFRDHGREPPPDQEVVTLLGMTDEEIAKRLLGDRSQDDDSVQELVRWITETYVSKYYKLLNLFPGVADCMSQLKERGIMLAVATNAMLPIVEKFLEWSGLGPLIDAVAAAGKIRGKPAPDELLEIAKKLRVHPDQILYVGDTPIDVLAARAAGAIPVAVISGIGSMEQLTQVKPEILLAGTAWICRAFVKLGERALVKEGDWVLLYLNDRIRYVIQARTDLKFHTHKGYINGSDLVAANFGDAVTTSGGVKMLVLRPQVRDFVRKFSRVTQIVYPKDAALILFYAGIGPGTTVIEAGVGSGGLTAALCHAVGPQGRVIGYDLNPSAIEATKKNLAMMGLDNADLRNGDVSSCSDGPVDAVVLDLPSPWLLAKWLKAVLKPASSCACICPTFDQVEKTVLALEAEGFADVEALELLERKIKVAKDATRPENLGLPHTAFLVFGRSTSLARWWTDVSRTRTEDLRQEDNQEETDSEAHQGTGDYQQPRRRSVAASPDAEFLPKRGTCKDEQTQHYGCDRSAQIEPDQVVHERTLAIPHKLFRPIGVRVRSITAFIAPCHHPMETGSVMLTVQEAMARDVGRMIARMNSKSMQAIGARVGDYVSIKGSKVAYATVWPASPQDESQSIIRIDGIIRENAGATIGDVVEVRRIELRPLSRLSLAPTESIAFGTDFRALVSETLQGKPAAPGNMMVIPIMGQAIRLYVTSAIPATGGVVSEGTEIMISSEAISMPSAAAPAVTYEDIGDMDDAKQKVREIVELPLKHPELFKHLGIEPPKGILLYGPPGTGKTLLARAIANETNSNFFTINGPEIMSKFYGEPEERVRDVFNKAEAKPPSIIFIDEIDAIAPKREEVSGDVEKRVVAQLLTAMDGLKNRGNVIVIGATNRVDAVDPALRRPGRFDREIETGIPDVKGRKEILQVHARNMPLAEDVNLDQLAEITHGYTGADLANLVKEAAMTALRRVLPSLNLKEGIIPTEVLSKIKVQASDFQDALRVIQPSALREFYVEVPEVHWEDVGGLEDVKQRLREAVEWPLKHPDYFDGMGIQPVKGILLYGPPGTGKTLLAKVVATESEANFISVKGPEILNKWVGESERAIRDIFRKARQSAPCVIFFDELDAIAPVRGQSFDSGVTERIVNQLLSEMDGISPLKNILVIGATNRADILDPALLRPGRFDQVVYVPPPDEKARLQILKIHSKKVPLGEDVSLEKVAALTEGYSGADLYALVRQAAIIRLRKEGKPGKVTMDDFHQAMQEVKPSLSKDQVAGYEAWSRKLQSSIL